jgi:hypothetical protein
LRGNGIAAVFAPDAMVYHPARRVTLRRWVYRLFQDRWHLLYRLKTTRPRSATIGECIDLVRRTGQLLIRRVPDQYPARLLSVGAHWLLLPIWIAYLMLWESRFRQMLSDRGGPATGAGR